MTESRSDGPSGKKLKCVKCGEIKPVSEFGSNSTSSTGYQSYCRECKNANHAKNQANNMQMRLRHHFYTRIKATVPNLPENFYPDMETYLGYSFRDLVRKLDKECQDSYGFNLKKAVNVYDYHIDHRTPLSWFDVPNVICQQFRECWAMTNLKAIPPDENLSKGARSEIDPITSTI